MLPNFRVLTALGLVAVAPAAFAQYTMDLTGVAPDSASTAGVYISPYQGTITLTATGQTLYSGFMICDDYTTESYLNTPWAATLSSNGGVLNGLQKFGSGGVAFNGNTYTAQQAYNAAAWLATQLVLPSNVSNPGNQAAYSFAIWNIFDPGAAATTSATIDSAAIALETKAFSSYDNTVESNVSVFTASMSNPNGVNQSQEFLVVNPVSAPEIDPTSAASGLALLLGGIVVLRGRRVVRTDDAI